MFRNLSVLMSGLACGALLLTSSPAEACGADKEHAACSCKHGHEKKAEKKADVKTEAKTAPANVLQPVDEILSATCNCTGPSDCTCKKGECKCKKCQKHHGIQKTQFLEPLRNNAVQPRLPENARFDATAGVFI